MATRSTAGKRWVEILDVLQDELPGEWSLRGGGMKTMLVREPLGWAIPWIGCSKASSVRMHCGVAPATGPQLVWAMGVYGLDMSELPRDLRSIELGGEGDLEVARAFAGHALARFAELTPERYTEWAERSLALMAGPDLPPDRILMAPGWRVVNDDGDPVEAAEACIEWMARRWGADDDVAGRYRPFYEGLVESWKAGGRAQALEFLAQIATASSLSRDTTAQAGADRRVEVETMTDGGNEAAPDIRAVLGDLLPILLPGATFEEATDEVIVPVPEGRARVAVTSLISTASGVPPERWAQLVEVWCAGILEMLQVPAPVLAPDQLRVRLVPTAPVAEDQVIVKPYGAYFQLELMADQPDRRLWVGPGRAAEIGLTPDDAFTQGLRNTISNVLVPLDVRRHDVGNGLTLSVGAADGVPWVSIGLTSLQNVFRAPQLPYGAIAAVPRLSAVMFTPVESDRVMADILLIGRLVADMYRDSEDPCSPDLFWFHGGALYRIERHDGTRVTLPVELEPLVAALPKA